MSVRQPKSTLKAIDLRRVAMLGGKVQARIDGVTDAYVQEEESDNGPGGEIDGDSVDFLGGVGGGSIGSTNTGSRDQEAREGKPEGTIGGECCLEYCK